MAPDVGSMRAPERWYVGGSPCAGKSTIAELIGRRHGLRVYHCDDNVRSRHALVVAAASPHLQQLTKLDTCERLGRDPRWQADMEVQYYREQFPLLLDELRAVEEPAIIEGADLLPELLLADLTGEDRAVWVVPTPAFQLEHYRRRVWAHELVAECSSPERAFANWMRRDILFAEYVAASAGSLGGTVVEVDGSLPVADVARLVEAALGLA